MFGAIIAENFISTKSGLELVSEDFDNTKISIGVTYDNFVADAQQSIGCGVDMFQEYGKWLIVTGKTIPENITKGARIVQEKYLSANDSLEQKISVANLKYLNIKQDYKNTNNLIEEKLASAHYVVTQTFTDTYQFITNPWRMGETKEPIVVETIKDSEALTSDEAFVMKQEIITLQKRIGIMERQGLPQKEIIKEIQKIIQIEPLKEITKEIKVIDDKSLADFKNQLSIINNKLLAINEWESDIKNLQQITQKLQVSPPQVKASSAPIYFASQGIQVGGHGTFASLGVSGSGSFASLAVGSSTSLGSTATDKLTVAATSTFSAPVTAEAGLTVGTSTLVIDSVGNISTTGVITTAGDIITTGTSDLTVAGDLTTAGDLTVGSSTTTTFADGSIIFAASSAFNLTDSVTNFLAVGSSGDVAITASGTNQNIILTPSGTGELHIEGQCVTGDTEITIVDEAGEQRNVEIKDIEPGMKALSLNEKTGELTPANIEALLDMGVKTVYELETASGKKVRTTGNHPYLVSDVFSGVDFNNFNQISGFDNVKNSNIAQSDMKTVADGIPSKFFNMSVLDGVGQFNKFNKFLFYFVLDSNRQAQNLLFDFFVDDQFEHKNQNLDNLDCLSSLKNFSPSTQPSLASASATIASYLAHASGDSISSTHLSNSFFSISNLFTNCFKASTNSSVLGNKIPTTDLSLINNGFDNNNESINLDKFNSNYNNNSKDEDILSRAKWIKVVYLKPGMKIAVADTEQNKMVWDEIVSIKRLGKKHVYDLSIENTHNFVANGIIAHNTYIEGNLDANFGLDVTGGDLTLDANDFKINTDKFVVTGATGNLNIGPDKFTVVGATGDTVIIGTLGITGATTGTTSIFTTSVTTPAIIAYNAGAAGNLTIDAKGTGTITLGATSTGDIILSRNVNAQAGLDITGADLTVGDGDLFKVDSSGIITAAAGITSSGTITFSGLDADRPVITTAGGELTTESQLATSRGGLGANVTAAGVGEILYSTATTTYGHLTAGTSGQVLLSGEADAPSWGVLTTTYGGTGVNLSAGAQGGLVYMGASSNMGVSAAGISGYALVSGDTGAPTWTNTPSWSTLSLSLAGDALTLSGAGANIDFSGAGLAQIKTDASQDLALMPGGSVGIGTIGPDAKLDVLDTGAQLRLTYTNESVFTDFILDANGDLVIRSSSASGGDVKFKSSVSTGINLYVCEGADCPNVDASIGSTGGNLVVETDAYIGGNLSLGDSYSKNATFSSITTATTTDVHITDIKGNHPVIEKVSLYISNDPTAENINFRLSFYEEDDMTETQLIKDFYFNLVYTEIKVAWNSGAITGKVDDTTGFLKYDLIRIMDGEETENVGITAITDSDTLAFEATGAAHEIDDGVVKIAEFTDTFRLHDEDSSNEIHCKLQNFAAPDSSMNVYLELEIQ